MSRVDETYKQTLRDILSSGFTTENDKVRPHWEDGTPAYTYKKFGVVNTYDLSEEFPMMSLRPTNLKAAIDEILWIYQKKSNNIHDLNSHIWDSWADKNGSIGRAYGWQVAQKSRYKVDGAIVEMDQTERVLWQLKNFPQDRAIMFNLYSIPDLQDMGLRPCVYNAIFNVTGKKLNCMLIQRSADMIVAGNWNVVQYAALVMMLARATGLEPGVMTHCIADAHIYDRHKEIAEELLKRPGLPAPKVTLNPEKTDFYDFTPEDFIVEDYEHYEQIKNIPVAI